MKYFHPRQSSASIVKASMMFRDWDQADPMPWTPSLDPAACSQPFLPRSLSEAVKAGWLVHSHWSRIFMISTNQSTVSTVLDQ